LLTLAADLAMRCDPGRLLAKMLGARPDAWQQELLRSSRTRLLLLCSRQSGKTAAAAGLALHTALYEPGSLCLIVSPGLRQSGELFRRILAGYRLLGRPVRALAETKLTLELANGSRLVALPGNEARIRSYSGVRLLLFEEAARTPDALYKSLRPMLAVSGGKLIALSTPAGARGWFYDEWKDRKAWDYFEVKATDCPRIPAAFLQEEEQKLGWYWYSQEYLLAWNDPIAAAFRHQDIEAAFTEVEQWQFPMLAA
jgi:hypothetical protein